MATDSTAKRTVEKDAPVSAAAPHVDAPLFNPLADLGPRQRIFFAVLVVLANLPLIHYFFKHTLQEMPVTTTIPFSDDFNRVDLGPNYWNTGGFWRIENGELHSPAVKNNALWLQAALPDNVAIEFDTRALYQEADIRCELFGDGFNHDSGYTFMFGGFNNQVTAIGRLNERGVPFNGEGIGKGGREEGEQALAGRSLAELQSNGTFGPNSDFRIERSDVRVQPGRMYHIRIEAKDQTLRWYIDGQLVLTLNDKYRLKGKDHNRFGLSGWDSDVFFDNLTIQPL
jgi:hypothetical protein